MPRTKPSGCVFSLIICSDQMEPPIRFQLEVHLLGSGGISESCLGCVAALSDRNPLHIIDVEVFVLTRDKILVIIIIWLNQQINKEKIRLHSGLSPGYCGLAELAVIF